MINRRSGTIAIQSGSPAGTRLDNPLDREGLVESLVEVEEILTPAFVREHVPPALAIAFLTDGIYGLLTGKSEIPTPELRTQFYYFVLLAWEHGWWIPRPAFPYTLEKVLRDFQTLPEQGDGEELRSE